VVAYVYIFSNTVAKCILCDMDKYVERYTNAHTMNMHRPWTFEENITPFYILFIYREYIEIRAM